MATKKSGSSAQLSLVDAPPKKASAPPPPAAPRASPVAAPRASPVAAPVAAIVVAPSPAAVEPESPEPKVARRATAEQMGSKQREISISEFFTKNRHLLGFDNPSKALLTTVKEAVDNSLDACEEAGILPEILVEIHDVTSASDARSEPGAGAGRLRRPAEGDGSPSSDKYRVAIEDNGPGIVRKQIDKVFGKLLYGSKFHRLKQSRGQQGIGISAAGMYGQLTTGKPVTVLSRIRKGQPVHSLDIAIDTRKNMPVVSNETDLADWPGNVEKEHGTRVEIEMVANYLHGQRFVLRYLEQTALANPHARVEYRRPKLPPLVFPRAAGELPREAVEIQPHPHGVELGMLQLMLSEAKGSTLREFLTTKFSRVGPAPAQEILAAAGLAGSTRPTSLEMPEVERLHKALTGAKLMAPPTNCLSPIGDALVRKGLMNFLQVIEEEGPELELALDAPHPSKAALEKAATVTESAPPPAPEAATPDAMEPGEEVIKGHKYFLATVTRPPKVYRGNPFQVEVGLAFGGSWPADKPIELYRFANRVPLLFQKGACGVTEAVVKTDWKNYMLSQSKGALPVGPMALLVHIASVWVPFTSESKEAIAHYPELIKEIQLGVQEVGRKLAAHIRKRKHADLEAKRRSIFELYIEELGLSMGRLLGMDPEKVKAPFLEMAREFTADADLEQAEAEAAVAAKAAKKKSADDEDEER